MVVGVRGRGVGKGEVGARCPDLAFDLTAASGVRESGAPCERPQAEAQSRQSTEAGEDGHPSLGRVGLSGGGDGVKGERDESGGVEKAIDGDDE